MGATPGLDESPISAEVEAAESTKRRPWSPEEDEHLRQLVDVHGIKSWALIATHLQMRNGKQCRERWRNHLRPQVRSMSAHTPALCAPIGCLLEQCLHQEPMDPRTERSPYMSP